jgi:phenylalanyl-tRNA synthetase beta chain
MNIKILDSWLKEFVKTDASAQKIAELMSLTSISIERVEPLGQDFVYDIEVTTNRPDLASVVGLAREAAAVLPQHGIKATFHPPKLQKLPITHPTETIKIINDPSLVHRICAVIMEVTVSDSADDIKRRLETSEIRSLNNVIDITNYVMRTIGHPAHVFDFDRLETSSLTIREAKQGEAITTLDKKTYTLTGGEIVATDDTGRIIDLLGIMGLENSVVTDTTKRILFFIDNNETHHIRQASMAHGIRTEAAQLNEKGIDPEATMDALLYGISLYKRHAKGKILSEIIDIYPNKPTVQTVSMTEEKLQSVIGVPVGIKHAAKMLSDLGFAVKVTGKSLSAIVPSFRAKDITIAEDLIEEVARVYGYHNIPSELPPNTFTTTTYDPVFSWEMQVKQALKYWGYTELYTYSMVSDTLIESQKEQHVRLANPLNEEYVYMRSSLIPSLVHVASQQTRAAMQFFEIANVYKQKGHDLPEETRMLAVLIKKIGVSFFDGKGLIEQLAQDLGIKHLQFEKRTDRKIGATIHLQKKQLGEILLHTDELLTIEINFDLLTKTATRKKVYTPANKYPPIIEDISVEISDDIVTRDIIETIKKQSNQISEVSLLDRYQNKRTFHLHYQDKTKNLTSEDASAIRKSIIIALKETYRATIL